MKRLFFVFLLVMVGMIATTGCVPNNQSTGYSYAPPLGSYVPNSDSESPAQNSTAQAIPTTKYTTVVTPEIATFSCKDFDVAIVPSNPEKYGLINSWILTIKNKSKADIGINWDKTMFIRDGQTDGGFMFSGVVYSRRNEKKPNDIIFSGKTFEKRIFPNNRVYYGSKDWGHNELSGECGVYLVVESGSNSTTAKMLMNFDIKKNY